jgi:hypothetical protein
MTCVLSATWLLHTSLLLVWFTTSLGIVFASDGFVESMKQQASKNYTKTKSFTNPLVINSALDNFESHGSFRNITQRLIEKTLYSLCVPLLYFFARCLSDLSARHMCLPDPSGRHTASNRSLWQTHTVSIIAISQTYSVSSRDVPQTHSASNRDLPQTEISRRLSYVMHCFS